MRKLVVTMFLALDGVIEEPMWSAPYWNDKISSFKGDESNASDALLLGRVTYEGFAAVWPNRTNEDDEGTEYMNSVAKYVVSNTLKTATWNNSQIISGDVVAQIKSLKATNGGNILVYGSGVLLKTLMEHQLVDEYRLLLYPVVVGAGQKMFADGITATLDLIEVTEMGSGVVALRYQPAPTA